MLSWNIVKAYCGCDEIQNSAPEASPGEIGAQAVAMRIAGDMAAFYGCGFVSSQDTLLDELGRHYFSDCYIVGNIDVIWGNGQSLYQVRIHPWIYCKWVKKLTCFYKFQDQFE